MRAFSAFVEREVEISRQMKNNMAAAWRVVINEWEIITPPAQGIIGFISPEGILMLPKGL